MWAFWENTFPEWDDALKVNVTIGPKKWYLVPKKITHITIFLTLGIGYCVGREREVSFLVHFLALLCGSGNWVLALCEPILGKKQKHLKEPSCTSHLGQVWTHHEMHISSHKQQWEDFFLVRPISDLDIKQREKLGPFLFSSHFFVCVMFEAEELTRDDFGKEFLEL